MANITANEEAIERLATDIPVAVWVTNPGGDRNWGLNINENRKEKFFSSPYLRDAGTGIRVVGELSEEAPANSPFAKEENRGKEGLVPYGGGDCGFFAVSSFSYVTATESEVAFIDGYDKTVFETDEAVCVIMLEVARRNGIEVGDEISLPLYSLTYDVHQNIIYSPLGEQTVKVVGTYDSRENPTEFLFPARWVTGVMESRGIDVNYNDMSGFLKDPRQLSVFKESIKDLGFLEPNPEAYMDFTGAAITVQDEQYITAAEPLGQTVVLFRRFQIPFFALVIGMIVLAIFLIMRGSRRVMAISVSLGRPRFLCAMGCFLAAFIAEIIGCALVFPAMTLLPGMSLEGAFMICLEFMLCACVGNAAALMLILRFDAFTLLTAVE